MSAAGSLLNGRGRGWCVNCCSFFLISRITSYNVCYTKLLRQKGEAHSLNDWIHSLCRGPALSKATRRTVTVFSEASAYLRKAGLIPFPFSKLNCVPPRTIPVFLPWRLPQEPKINRIRWCVWKVIVFQWPFSFDLSNRSDSGQRVEPFCLLRNYLCWEAIHSMIVTGFPSQVTGVPS